MVAKKKTAGRKEVGKLKLKKETIRDLDAGGKSGKIKGGQKRAAATAGCPSDPPCIRISEIC